MFTYFIYSRDKKYLLGSYASEAECLSDFNDFFNSENVNWIAVSDSCLLDFILSFSDSNVEDSYLFTYFIYSFDKKRICGIYDSEKECLFAYEFFFNPKRVDWISVSDSCLLKLISRLTYSIG